MYSSFGFIYCLFKTRLLFHSPHIYTYLYVHCMFEYDWYNRVGTWYVGGVWIMDTTLIASWLFNDQREKLTHKYNCINETHANVCIKPQYEVGDFCIHETWGKVIYHCNAACFPCPNHYNDHKEKQYFRFSLKQNSIVR